MIQTAQLYQAVIDRLAAIASVQQLSHLGTSQETYDYLRKREIDATPLHPLYDVHDEQDRGKKLKPLIMR